MSIENRFGPLVDGDIVELALLEFLKGWMPTYVAEVLRMKDPDHSIYPKGVEPVREFTVKHAAAEKWPEERLPMLLANAPGDGGKPSKRGDGQTSATFTLGLTAISQGVDPADAKLKARIYSGAALMAILQHPDLGGFARDVDWVGFENQRITRGVEAERSIMAAANLYTIEVPNVLNRNDGPLEPLEDPDTDPGPWPKVKEGGSHLQVESGKAAVDLLRSGSFFGDQG